MNSETIRDELRAFLEGLEIIDAHEHLVPERDRLKRRVSVLNLVAHYAWVDIVSAGLPKEHSKGFVGHNEACDDEIPVEERWKTFWPHIQQVQYGTYFRPTAIALRDLYGIAKLDDSTWREASERMAAANRPGLYRSILREKCRIRVALVQNGHIDDQDPPELFIPVYQHATPVRFEDRGFIEFLGKRCGTTPATFGAYLEAFGHYLVELRSKGAAGFKIGAWEAAPPDAKAATEEYAAFVRGEPAGPSLFSATLDYVCKRAAEWDWPVCVHTGVWGDFRGMQPLHALDLVMRYPDTRFDIYHLGMPEVRECIFIAKNFRNAVLNLCWCYIVSQEITRRAINEILDLVPVNKVFGFGGDYQWDVENVYGHLTMAREALAEALTERIQRGQIDLDGARYILRLWMFENPKQFYGLR